mgnify:CR=1 FL=1
MPGSLHVLFRCAAVLAPATGETIADVPSSGAADVDAAVEAAATAFETWGRMTPRARSEVLHKVADAIEADLDELKRIEMENCGKPASMIEFEMDLTLDNWRFFAGGARFLEGRAGLERLDATPGYGALAMLRDRTLLATEGFRNITI